MNKLSIFRKKYPLTRYVVCVLAALSVLALKWYAPEFTNQYAEEVCAIIKGDTDFASAAEVIQAWATGDIGANEAVQEAARFAFGIDTGSDHNTGYETAE